MEDSILHVPILYVLFNVVTGFTLGLKLRVCKENLFSYFSTKTYVVGTQKNRLNETVL